MPGPITHLQAAYYYNVSHGLHFGAQFYLGCISPDCVNINGHAPKDKRWPAHLRDRDLEIWTANAQKFYQVYKGEIDEPYLRGYILHILTDIVWDKSFDRPLYAMLLREGIPERELKTERWNEIYGYEQTQIVKPWLREDVLPALSSAVPECIGTLDPREIGIWQSSVVSLELDKGKPPRFVDEALMSQLFKEVSATADVIF